MALLFKGSLKQICFRSIFLHDYDFEWNNNINCCVARGSRVPQCWTFYIYALVGSSSYHSDEDCSQPDFRDEEIKSEKGSMLSRAIAIKSWGKVKYPGPSDLKCFPFILSKVGSLLHIAGPV